LSISFLSFSDTAYELENSTEEVEVLPIEVPISPPTNGHIPHISLDLDLPGTPERSREYDNFNTAHQCNFAASENDITDITTLDSRSSKDLSETSSNISAESNTLLLSNGSKSATSVNTNSRNSVKKNQSNTEQHQVEFEMSVIHNGKVVDNPTAATC